MLPAGPGEALVENQLGIVGDGRALQTVGVADQRAAADVPVLGASAGQRPDRGADLVEDGKPAVLLRGADVADIEDAEQRSRDYRVAELEGVAPSPEHIAVDGETGSERERKRTAREVDRGTAAIDSALVEDAAGSGHVDPEVGDRALRVAGDGQGLIDDASARVRDRIDPVSRDRDSVVERAGVGDRVLAAGDAEGLVDERSGPVRDRIDAIPRNREPVVERAGVVDRVLAARDAEDLIDERAGLVGDAVDAGAIDDQAVVEGAAVEDRRLGIARNRNLAVDVAAGLSGDAVDAVAADGDAAVEVAGIYDGDRAVTGPDDISVDRAVAGVVERLA